MGMHSFGRLRDVEDMEYRQLEAILCELHSVPKSGVIPLRSRLRILRQLGVPNLMKPGSGSRLKYRLEDLWETHLALIFEAFGLPPLRVKFLVEFVRSGFSLNRAASARKDRWLFAMDVALGAPGHQVQIIENDDHMTPVVTTIEAVERSGKPASVMALFNLSRAARDCIERATGSLDRRGK